MSNGNDRPGNLWDDEYENGDPQSLRDAYPRAANRNRPRSNDTSLNDLPETPDRSDNRARPRNNPMPGRSTDQPMRSRPTRQSRDEVYARLRQRPRRPIYARDPEDPHPQTPNQSGQQGQPATRREEVEEYPYQQSPARVPRGTRPDPTERGSAPGAPARPGKRSIYDVYDETDRTIYKGEYGRDRAMASDEAERVRYRGQRGHERAMEYEEYDEYEVVQARPRRPTSQQRRRSARGRSAFSTVLIGCVGGLITLLIVAGVLAYFLLNKTPLGPSLGIGKGATYTRTDQQALTLGSATQLIVKNQAGNVTLSVNQGVSSGSVESIKKVLASSQSDANNQYSGIVLSTKQISQGGDPACTASSCLLITTTLPISGNGGLPGANNGNSIDLNITLPASFNSPDPLSPYTINVNAPAGDISVNGFNGRLNLTGNVSTIHVTHTLIYAGTCIQTMHGNVNVDQDSFFNLALPSNIVPCSTSPSTTSLTPLSSDQHPWFNLRSSVGDVNVTLSPNSTNLLLDANINNGKINDDFNLNIAIDPNDAHSASYHGPLLPNTSPKAALYIFTSTGNITVHRG